MHVVDRRMHLSKSIVRAEVAPQKVLDFVPPKFELGTPEQTAVYFEQRRNAGSDFRMNDAVRVQTGVDAIESQNSEEAIERRVIEKLKEVQETAYQEAYMLGLDEGKRDAMQAASAEIKNRLDGFDELISTIGSLKKELLACNETHIVQLAFQMAKRMAHAEIQANPNMVTQVIKEALEKAQVEENIVVQISPMQMEFLESLKTESGREFEFMKKIKLEPSEDISAGGCIIRTNFGEIDARVEGRVEMLWEGIKDSLHRVKDEIGKE